MSLMGPIPARKPLDSSIGPSYPSETMPATTDTSPEIAEMVRTRIMARSGSERFVMGVEMCNAARRMVLASLPASLNDAERKQHLFHRFQGDSIPQYAAEQQISEEEALAKGMAEKSVEFHANGAELYAKA